MGGCMGGQKRKARQITERYWFGIAFELNGQTLVKAQGKGSFEIPQTEDKVHYRYISGIPGISLRWALPFLLSVYLVWKELFDPGAAKSPVKKRAQTDEKSRDGSRRGRYKDKTYLKEKPTEVSLEYIAMCSGSG